MTVHIESAPLSLALREHTATAHEQAEGADFVSELLAGSLSAEALVGLLTQSLPVYETLEQACRAQADSPVLGPLLDPTLERSERLRRDLAHHHAAGRRFDRTLPATEAYVEELHANADRPAALLAHHYVRYLGDLSGGQIIARLVQRHYDVDASGLQFYAFDIDQPKRYKDAYRARLDALPLDAAQRDEALTSASRAFDLNRRLFDELGHEFSG